jgi:hypothetical protein
MEALTACSVALLTIYDMCKAVDRGMVMGGVRLMEKRGGEEWGVCGQAKQLISSITVVSSENETTLL